MRSSARAIAVALLLAACAGREGHGAVLTGGTYGSYDVTGLASWYGEEAAGNRTASGARFDPGAITAAHRTLPLGSYVEVTSIGTGRSIVALVNDRGPGRSDRIIDLSRGAAQALGTDRQSVATVRIRAIASRGVPVRSDFVAPPLPFGDRRALTESAAYIVQVASFASQPRAATLAERIVGQVAAAGTLFRVRLGPFTSASAAQRARDAVAVRGYGDAQILPATPF